MVAFWGSPAKSNGVRGLRESKKRRGETVEKSEELQELFLDFLDKNRGVLLDTQMTGLMGKAEKK